MERAMKKEKNKLQIRNSTAEFLIFTRQAGEDGIEVRVADETVWLTQKLMAALFEVTVPTINEHLANLYAQGEICQGQLFGISEQFKRKATARCRGRSSSTTSTPSSPSASGSTQRAIQFRQWATGVLRDFAIRGYVLDKERLKNGAFLQQGVLRQPAGRNPRNPRERTEVLPEDHRHLRHGDGLQRRLPKPPRTFFATVQNKLHFAIHGQTAAELIVERADATRSRWG